MAAKCPLCGGKTVNSECTSCGYRLPDEDDISSLYNYDPSDYPQENPVMPETGYNYAEPESVDVPEFKVRENPYAENADKADTYENNNNNNPYANFNPYQPQQPGGNRQPYRNPYANGNFKPYTSNNSSSDFGSFLQKNWWLLLLSFFVPVLGIILFFTMKNSVDPKYRWLLIAASIAGFIL